MKIPRIAIIGAGIAGLACARRLDAAGCAVELFDKARRAGGRMASRALVVADSTTLLDHGAQYFTARTPDFRALCSEALMAGVITPWDGELRDERAGTSATHDEDERYRGQPDMNALPRWLARGLPLQCQAAVQALHRATAGWSLEISGRPAAGGFAAVVVALPAEQTAALLASLAPALAAEAAAACSAPCWAGLFGFGRAARWPTWRALRPAADHPLAWLARSRDGHGLIAHATPAWSRAHLEQPASTVQAALLSAVHQCAPGLGRPAVAAVHRWRYALVEKVTGVPYRFDSGSALAVCGDWRLGPRVECAWLSGDTLGAALPGLLHKTAQA